MYIMLVSGDEYSEARTLACLGSDSMIRIDLSLDSCFITEGL